VLIGRPLRGAAVAACAVAVLTGCQDDPQAQPDPPRPVSAGDEYVALGDSYTAAPGTGPVDVEDGCVRSVNNYPHLVATELGLELNDVSCGGARTDALYASQRTPAGVDRPPQLHALSEATDLVTLRIGANDFNLYGNLVQRCVEAAQGGQPAPCTEEDAIGGTSALDGIIEEMVGRLDRAIAEVRERAPDARILVVGYPQFVPPIATCEQLPIAAGDYPFARRVNDGLIAMLEQAAERADAEYLDVAEATLGHDMCSPEAWIAGAVPARPGATAFHPYPEEQRAVADLVVEHLADPSG